MPIIFQTICLYLCELDVNYKNFILTEKQQQKQQMSAPEHTQEIALYNSVNLCYSILLTPSSPPCATLTSI